jgi:hypothetical protein
VKNENINLLKVTKTFEQEEFAGMSDNQLTQQFLLAGHQFLLAGKCWDVR